MQLKGKYNWPAETFRKDQERFNRYVQTMGNKFKNGLIVQINIQRGLKNHNVQD